MTTRVRNLKIGQRFTLVRTDEKYELVSFDRATPSGTRYIVRRMGADALTSLHPSCHVILDGEPAENQLANQAKTSGSPMPTTPNVAVATPDVASDQTKGES